MIAGAGGQRRTAWLMLLPAIAVLGLFVLWPTLRAFWWSLTDARLLAPGEGVMRGAENYSALLQHPRFRQAFANTALFALMVIPLQTVPAFFMALLVDRPERCWRWLRVVFFLPVVVSMPVLAVLWTMLYQPVQGDEMGLINAAVTALGLPGQAWLRDPLWALPAIAFMSIWQGAGFQMMVFLAGLQNLSGELLDAAKIDGANAVQRLLHVILPGMRNTIVFVVTATLILAFRLFVQPYLMTRGGPDGHTLSLIQMIYETTFISRDLGLACAAAMVFLLVVGVLTWLQRLVLREERA